MVQSNDNTVTPSAKAAIPGHLAVFLKEFEKENRATREMLSRIPDNLLDWQPHPKSMTFRSLATHIAELPAWPEMILHTEGLNFATMPYTPPAVNTNAQLLELYDKSYAAGHKALQEAREDILTETWTLQNGDKILGTDTKLENIRMSFCQIVHHRAQLGVFLRLNNIPLPPSYGPSADEGSL